LIDLQITQKTVTLFTKKLKCLMKKFYLLLALLTGLGMYSCGSDSKEKTPQTFSEGGISVDKETKVTEEEISGICIWDKVALRETPAEKGKWLTSINLGEEVVFLNETETDNSGAKPREYIKVQLQGGKEGWVIKDFVALNAKAAAFTEETDMYQRPDLLTKAGKAFSKMDVVAIASTQDDWLEVKGKRKNGTWIESGWVKSGNLTLKKVDIAVAVYTNKALQQKDEQKQKEEMQKIVDNQDLNSSIFITELLEFITPTPVQQTSYAPEEEDVQIEAEIDSEE
jgi:hypothetical protein